MDDLLRALAVAGICLGITLIIPLWVWMDTGSFRRAMQALGEFWLLIACMLGLALLFAVSAVLTGH